MNRLIEIAPLRKSVVVEAAPQQAFEVFSHGIDRWWPKSHALSDITVRESIIEPFVGGRWYTRHSDGSEVTVGHVRAWEPPRRLVISWAISAEWKPEPREAYASEIEVAFAALGDGRTRVDLEHRDFERMGAAGGNKMRGAVDGGWPMILDLYVAEVARSVHP